jgi:hypothetical protein
LEVQDAKEFDEWMKSQSDNALKASLPASVAVN